MDDGVGETRLIPIQTVDNNDVSSSAALRNDYSTISNLAKETNEPIYIEH